MANRHDDDDVIIWLVHRSRRGNCQFTGNRRVRPHRLAVIAASSPCSHTEGCRLRGPELPVTTLDGRCPADVSTTTR